MPAPENKNASSLPRKVCFKSFESEDFWPCTGRLLRQTVLAMEQQATSVDEPITILSEGESWNLLPGVALGRLVISIGGQPEIFPVNFVTQRHAILVRMAEGTKLSTL